MREPGRDEPEERLADLELDEARFVDYLLDVTTSVEQRHQDALFPRQAGSGLGDPRVIDGEDEIERGDLLLDQTPFVHPPGAFEEKEFGIDPNEKVFPLGTNTGLEVEGARRPGEQVVDRLLDLHADVTLELLPGQCAELDEDLSDLVLAVAVLAFDGLLECLRGHPAVPNQDISEAVATVDDRRVDDVPSSKWIVPKLCRSANARHRCVDRGTGAG